MSAERKFGGWYRLWLLIAALYAVAVVIVGFRRMPTELKLNRAWASEIVAWTVKSKNGKMTAEELRQKFNLSDRDSVLRITEWAEQSLASPDRDTDLDDLLKGLQGIGREYKVKREHLPQEQVQFVAVALASWASTVLLLLVIGYGVDWVRRGFQEGKIATRPIAMANPTNGIAPLINEEAGGVSPVPPLLRSAAIVDVVRLFFGPKISRIDYWYGYLYMAFCVYLAYCAEVNFLSAFLKPSSFGSWQRLITYGVTLTTSAGLALFLFSMAYMLLRRRMRMGLIYTVVALHGLNVLFRGIRPLEVIFWLALSWIVVSKFRKQKRLIDASLSNAGSSSVKP
jgi:hypothetical protein